MISSSKELQWVNKSHSDRFRHIQAQSGVFETLCKPDIFRAVVYPEPWYIPGIFKTRNIFKTLVYSEPRYIENSGIFKTQGLFRHLRCQTSTMKRFKKTVNEK